MWGLLKGRWVILVIFTLSPLLGKLYKTSLISKGLLQAAWCCLWFSLLWFCKVLFWNLHNMQAVKQLQLTQSLRPEVEWQFSEMYHSLIIKNLRYVAKGLFYFAIVKKINKQQIQPTNQCPQKNTTKVHLPVFSCISLYLSYVPLVRTIVRM